MNKEDIAREALEEYMECLTAFDETPWQEFNYKRLAKEAFVSQVDIVHEKNTIIHFDAGDLDEYSETYIELPGHQLRTGSALMLIIPFDKE